MVTIRYVGPIDEVDVVGAGTVKRGDSFEATEEHAESLLKQPDNYEAVGDGLDLLKVPDLRDLAAEKGIDVTGLKKKADFVAAIRKG